MKFCVYIAFVILLFSIFVFNCKYIIYLQLKTFIEIILCSNMILALFVDWILELLRQCGDFRTVTTVWWFWNCYDSVVILELFRQCSDFGTVPTVWYFWHCSDSVVFLELFRQCGDIGTVPTVWYFWNCSDSVVFLELFRQCGDFGTVPTVW
jgi:hypothetical protein